MNAAVTCEKCGKPLGVFDEKICIECQKPCDDAISRDAVINLLVKLGFGDEGNGSDAEYMSALWDVNNGIKKLPSVTPKLGKWILLDECANSGYYCSNCQKKLVKEGWSQTVKKINYCPHCGAYMREEQTE